MSNPPGTTGPCYWRHYNYPICAWEEWHPLFRWIFLIFAAAWFVPPTLLVLILAVKLMAAP